MGRKDDDPTHLNPSQESKYKTTTLVIGLKSISLGLESLAHIKRHIEEVKRQRPNETKVLESEQFQSIFQTLMQKLFESIDLLHTIGYPLFPDNPKPFKAIRLDDMGINAVYTREEGNPFSSISRFIVVDLSDIDEYRLGLINSIKSDPSDQPTVELYRELLSGIKLEPYFPKTQDL